MSSLSTIKAFTHWVSLKKYRIEVTYGVYVFTPMEKAVFWTIFCFLFTFISFAALLYTQRNVLLLIRYAAVYVTKEGGATSAVSNLFPKSHAALSVSESGISSLAETLGVAANSQAP